MDETDWTTKTPPATAPNAARSAGAESQPETRDGLRMSREEMTELAHRTVEHLVDRVDGLCIMNHSTTWNDVRETLESIEKSGVDALAVHEK